MTKNNKRDMITLKGLESKLRSLPDVEPSSNLKYRLLSLIPSTTSAFGQKFAMQWYFKVLDFGATTAAAVLILSLMLMLNYSLSRSSQMPFSKFKDTSLCYTRWDQNNVLCDQNTAYAGMPNLRLPILKQSEP